MLCEVFRVCFSGLTGYFGQDYDLYFGREALRVHFLGRRSNHVTELSTPNESGEYLISFFTLFTFTFYNLNIGDNVHLKCKGGKLRFLR